MSAQELPDCKRRQETRLRMMKCIIHAIFHTIYQICNYLLLLVNAGKKEKNGRIKLSKTCRRINVSSICRRHF
jgi:hypothetical protein